VARGCTVIDNSSAWRMEPAIPLVVSQVNPADLEAHEGIIANPNCSTMQLVPPLRALRDAVGLERVVVDTYQAVSGTGGRAIAELETQIRAHAAGVAPEPHAREPITPDRARELFAAIPGVVVRDDPAAHVYPLATDAAGHDEIYVGRVRTDPSIPGGRGLALWVVSDNVRKGAASNAVEIAEVLVERGWVRAASRRAAEASPA